MQIFVDADACPVVRIVEEIAEKGKISYPDDAALRHESCPEF